MTEGEYKRSIIMEIRRKLKGECIILKNDPTFLQGIPDILILYDNRWAALEIKRGKHSAHRPNQDYYIEKMNKMAFASFIYPENEEDVLDELYRYFLEE